jgi:hypothetical protein
MILFILIVLNSLFILLVIEIFIYLYLIDKNITLNNLYNGFSNV